MKKTGIITAIICVFLLAACIAGCGKSAKEEEVTAASLARQVKENTENAAS